MVKLFTRSDQLRLAEVLLHHSPTSMDYTQAVDQLRYSYGVHFVSLREVGLWCPGNGVDSIYDAISFSLLTFPEKLTVFLSSRGPTEEELVNWIVEVGESSTRRGVTDLPVVHLVSGTVEERSNTLQEISPRLDHMTIYGSEKVCSTVAGLLSPTTPRVIYGSKTSISIQSEPGSHLEYFKDAVSAGSLGCLNSTVLYVDLGTEPDTDILESEFEEALTWSDKTWGTDLQSIDWNWMSTFHKYLIECTSDSTRYSHSLSRGRLVVRKEEQGPRPSTGIGGGTYVIVNTPTPLETAEREWSSQPELLSSCSTDLDHTPSLYEMGISRVTKPGYSQKPSGRWYHDGNPLIPNSYKLANEDPER